MIHSCPFYDFGWKDCFTDPCDDCPERELCEVEPYDAYDGLPTPPPKPEPPK